MSMRETSVYASGNEIRNWIGLQFFAEAENDGAAEGADTDGDIGAEFESGLFDGDLEDQQEAEQNTGKDGDDGLEDQQPNGQQMEPEQKTDAEPDKKTGEEPQTQKAQPKQAPQMVQINYKDQSFLLPRAAVDEIGRALGANAVELLQKGMNYDQKADRELAILGKYAEASNMTLQQFVEQLEINQKQQELAAEVEKCRQEFPDSEDSALQEIAKSRVASRRAAEMQKAHEREAQAQALQNRVDQTVQQMQQKKIVEAWDAYEAQTGIHEPKNIPPRVLELVQQGHTPLEAHWQYQSEQAQAQLKQKNDIEQQANRNRETTTGSLAGSAVESDQFLAGLFGD